MNTVRSPRPFAFPRVVLATPETKMILKRISDAQAAELTDSILVSVGAEDPDSIAAGVIWMAEGNVLSDEGPLMVPEALTLAQTLADEQGRDTIYINCQPDDFEWPEKWGRLS
ncbi:MAG: hypothetical protein EON58_10795 [Alphaproteobacteria bacterium]|nr:MAG: hypothetical protein EON58_10795 [Alphaproteobacteria bacterium]